MKLKKVKEIWGLIDSVGPTYKDYLEDLEEGTNVFLIMMKDNPTTLQTVSKLIDQKCNVTLVFDQSNKKLYKKYEDKLFDYKTAIILDSDTPFFKWSLNYCDYLIVDPDTVYYDCLTGLENKDILFINHIPFRPFMGVKLDRPRLWELREKGHSIKMSQFIAHVFDCEEQEYLLDMESTIKVDLSTDRVEAFESEDRCVKTYNILDYLEERRKNERKANIHKQLPKATTRKSTRGEDNKS